MGDIKYFAVLKRPVAHILRSRQLLFHRAYCGYGEYWHLTSLADSPGDRPVCKTCARLARKENS